MATTPIPARPPGEPPSPIQTRPRAIQVTSQAVQPSMRLYVQDEDLLQLAVLANFNNAQVQFQIRFLKPDGQIDPTVKPVTAPTAGVFSTLSNIPLGEGVILSIALSLTNALLNGQWVYANATLRRGGIAIGTTFEELVAGYVAGAYAPSWPDWTPQRPTDGPGFPVSFAVANPAAGQDWTVTVPTSRRWQLLAARAAFVASATVANRFPGIIHTDGTTELYRARTNTAVTASQSTIFVDTPGVQPFSNASLEFLLPLPSPDILEEGYVISSSTVGIQATDQWSGIQLMVQEWAEIP